MATNKMQAVIAYVNANPTAIPSEVATTLNRQGIKITAGYVTTICNTTAPPTVEKSADALTADQLKMVAQAIKRVRSRKVAPMT